MKKALCWTSLCVIILLFTAAAFATQKVVVTESGFSYIDLEGGGGQTAEIGKIAVIHFTAWLDDNNTKGEIIFNSRKHGKPVSFRLGTDRVIKAWNLGVAGMKVGGKRRLMVNSEMAYGAKGSGNVIPPYTDLIYDIELIVVPATCSKMGIWFTYRNKYKTIKITYYTSIVKKSVFVLSAIYFNSLSA